LVAPFLSVPKHRLTLDAILTLLDMHGSINACALIIWESYAILSEEESKLDLLNFAELVAQLGRLMDNATQMVAKGATALAGAPLTQTPHFFKQWLETASKYREHLEELALTKAVAKLDACRTVVENNCPKWGTAISDTVFNLEMATLLFVKSKQVEQLPSDLSNLWEKISLTKKVCTAMSLQPPAEHMLTREWVALAMNALMFGKQTVKIAAAIDTIVHGKVGQLGEVMKHKAEFPATLLQKLENLEVEEEQRPETQAAQLGLKRSGSAASLANSGGSQVAKRPKVPASQTRVPANSGPAPKVGGRQPEERKRSGLPK